MNINLRDIPDGESVVAVMRAVRFTDEFPDRVGVRNGVGYASPSSTPMYVYRTKAGAIVVCASQQGSGKDGR